MTHTHGQFLRYAIVGMGSNALLYVLFLALTAFGLGHKTAMTCLFGVGIVQSFYFNKRWSFGHDGAAHMALVRYLSTYALFYLINLGALYLFVDRLSFSHAWVQGLTMLAIIVPIFLMQKFWVFPQVSQGISESEA